ncbi:MAG: PIN domain nuclease [Candidatus Omnitrophota bacterium]
MQQRHNRRDMDRKLKVYLDTSIINFAIADDIPRGDKEATQCLCEQINKGKYEGLISEVMLREINDTKDQAKRGRLVKFVESLELKEVLVVDDEVNTLAEKYISENIIPARYVDDALHIALASVSEADVLVSWNFKHIVRHKTRIEVMGVNTLMGYKSIDICTPREVIEDV